MTKFPLKAAVILSIALLGLSSRCFALSAEAPAKSSTTKHEAAKTPHPAPAATKQSTAVIPKEIDPALRDSQSHLVNANLLGSLLDGYKPFRDQKAKETLEVARQQRRDNQFPSAHTNLVNLIESDAPIEVVRSARLELALLLQDQGELAKAQQLYAHYIKLYPEDPSVPEVILRQGLVYRQMGAFALAMSKFYSVMTASLNLKADRVEYYQHLVLLAQSEIADTYYLQGKFGEAAEFFTRLLKLNDSGLNEGLIRAKLVRCKIKLGQLAEAVSEAELFLTRSPESPEIADIRYLLAESLRKLGRNHESVQQIQILLKSQQERAVKNPVEWAQWQRRVGNDLANQLYSQGDYLNALEIYSRLAELDHSPEWELPVWYQIGLVYERLEQTEKAAEAYDYILTRAKDLAPEATGPNLKTIAEMARWRSEHLQWLIKAELDRRRLVPMVVSGTEKASLTSVQ